MQCERQNVTKPFIIRSNTSACGKDNPSKRPSEEAWPGEQQSTTERKHLEWMGLLSQTLPLSGVESLC